MWALVLTILKFIHPESIHCKPEGIKYKYLKSVKHMVPQVWLDISYLVRWQTDFGACFGALNTHTKGNNKWFFSFVRSPVARARRLETPDSCPDNGYLAACPASKIGLCRRGSEDFALLQLQVSCALEKRCALCDFHSAKVTKALSPTFSLNSVK